MEIPPISYNEYMAEFGGTYAEFSLRSLAYMLQQQQDTLDSRTKAEWEAALVGIDRYSGRPIDEDSHI